MFVWSSEVSCINSTPFFRLKIVSTNVKTYKCTTTLLYIVFKKGDIIMTLGNDNAGNWSKCVMLCSVNMICIYKFHFLLCISIHLCKCFTIIAVLLCTLQSIRKRLFLGRNRVHWSLTTIIWVLFAHFPIEIFSNYYSANISYSNYY